MRQQLEGTVSAFINAPDAQVSENQTTREFELLIRIINVGHIAALKIHGSFRVTIISFPDLKVVGTPTDIAVSLDQLRALGDGGVWGKTIALPALSVKDRDYTTQTRSVMVKGDIEYDNGFGVISKRTMCSKYIGRYNLRYPDGSTNGGGGPINCADLPDLIKFLQAPTNTINRQLN